MQRQAQPGRVVVERGLLGPAAAHGRTGVQVKERAVGAIHDQHAGVEVAGGRGWQRAGFGLSARQFVVAFPGARADVFKHAAEVAGRHEVDQVRAVRRQQNVAIEVEDPLVGFEQLAELVLFKKEPLVPARFEPAGGERVPALADVDEIQVVPAGVPAKDRMRQGKLRQFADGKRDECSGAGHRRGL